MGQRASKKACSTLSIGRKSDCCSHPEGHDDGAKVELIYFDGQGRAELIRAALRTGGVKFVDNRVKMSDWDSMRNDPKSMAAHRFGALPVLVHGDAVLAQSIAIAQYAAELGLYKQRPVSARQRSLDLMVLGAHAQLQRAMFDCYLGDAASQAAGKAALHEKVSPLLAGLERMYSVDTFREGEGPFLYTSRAEGPMLGDLAVTDAVTSSFPGLQALGVCMDCYPSLMSAVNACKVSGMQLRQGEPAPARKGVLSVRVLAAHDLPNSTSGLMGRASDMCVHVQVGATKHRTRVTKSANPVWNSGVFSFPVDLGDAVDDCCAPRCCDADRNDILLLQICDVTRVHAAVDMGEVKIDIRSLPAGEWVHRREKLCCTDQGTLEVELCWSPGSVAGTLELIAFDEHSSMSTAYRADLPRALLHVGQVPFTDTKVRFEDWSCLKHDMKGAPARCFGALPVLAHDDNLLAQSIAIVQYAADVGLYAKRKPTALERGLDMMIICTHEDLQRSMFPCYASCHDEKEISIELLPEKVAPLLDGLERLYAGQGPFLYTSAVEGPMPGDLAVADIVNSPYPGLKNLGVDLTAYPKLRACVAACGAFTVSAKSA